MKRQRRGLTAAETQEALRWVETLANVLGCAGPPGCPAEDGERCTSCEALAWLQQLHPARREPRTR